MDRWKYYEVTHRDHDLMNPLPEASLEEALDRAGLPAGARVLDVGCGKGRLLLRLMERGAGSGVGVDLSPPFVRAARERVRARGPGRDLRILEGDGASFDGEPGSFDLASCLGASWIWGGSRPMLRALARWVRPGGVVLAMQPFWRAPPDPAYLSSQGLRAEEFGAHADNLADGVAEGLTLLHARESTPEEWERYEGLQLRAAEAWARENPRDPDVPGILARARASHADYVRWGKEGLGDALYLYRRENSPDPLQVP